MMDLNEKPVGLVGRVLGWTFDHAMTRKYTELEHVKRERNGLRARLSDACTEREALRALSQDLRGQLSIVKMDRDFYQDGYRDVCRERDRLRAELSALATESLQRQVVATSNSSELPNDTQVEELAKVLCAAAAVGPDGLPLTGKSAFTAIARAAYAHIGGMRVSVTEEEIANAIEGALELESEHQAAAVMALLRERGVAGVSA